MEVNKCADEFAGCTSPAILFSSHEQKSANKEANEGKKHRAARGRARRAANALWTLHHLWLQGARSAGRGRRPGAGQLERKNHSPGACPLAVPDGRRAHFAAL